MTKVDGKLRAVVQVQGGPDDKRLRVAGQLLLQAAMLSQQQTFESLKVELNQLKKEREFSESVEYIFSKSK